MYTAIKSSMETEIKGDQDVVNTVAWGTAQEICNGSNALYQVRAKLAPLHKFLEKYPILFPKNAEVHGC